MGKYCYACKQRQARIDALEAKVKRVYSAGMSGISYVERANYSSRANEARADLHKALKENG